MKGKVFTLVCILGLLLGTSAALFATPTWAAKGGAARLTAPRSMPAAPAASTPAAAKGARTAPNNGTAAEPKANGQTGAQANTQQKTANQQAAQAQTGTQRSSVLGGAMRNIGLFAGGMFLGSMLSGLLGWGSMGFMSEILGMLFNIIAIYVVIKLVLWAWRSLRGRKTETSRDDEAYRRGYEAAMRSQRQKGEAPYTIDVTPVEPDRRDVRK